MLATVTGLARSAVERGVRPDGILIDPAHDFNKNTWQSLEISRRLDELAATGWPLLVALSNKDFVGETLDLPVDQRLEGTLATTAVAAWLGARVFRAHHVRETRRVLDMVASIRGDRPIKPKTSPGLSPSPTRSWTIRHVYTPAIVQDRGGQR